MKKIFSMGIMNYCSHDPACALIKFENSKLEYIHAEEGFLSRKKKSYQFPLRSIKYCLDYFSTKIEDIDLITFDYMDYKRSYRTSNNYRLLVGDFIRSKLKVPSEKINFISSHHYAHALTAFWPSGFDESAVLIVDGLGSEQQTHSIYHMDTNGRKDLIFEQKGVGIGSLYSLITKKLGFDTGEEGKTMGLAPYGAQHKNLDKKLPSLNGKFDSFFTDYSEQMYRSPTKKLKIHLKDVSKKKDVYKPYYSRLAYNLQKETERCLKYLATQSINKTKCNNLCFSGGVALNCVANEKINDLKSVENFYVFPASGDSGLPIGLALSGLESMNINLKKIFTFHKRKFFSIPFSQDKLPLTNYYEDDLKKIFRKYKIHKRQLDLNEISSLLAKKKIIGICSEGIELGPRALGHRSFLADARDRNMKDVLNKKIKHREAYRPFAPIILQNQFNNFFKSKNIEHPYMLMAPKCKKKAELSVPAICHVDKTARVQTITNINGKIDIILSKYMNITGVPVLINTSFNDNNEPIAFTKLDAFLTFLRCKPDVLVFDDFYLIRNELKNISNLKKDLEKLQKKVKDIFYVKAIKEITKITKKTNKSEIKNFLRFNQKLSITFRKERMILKLIDFVTSRNKERTLYIDKYHLDILNKLSIIIGLEFNEICPIFKIVKDKYFQKVKIKKHSDIMLYNFSSYFLNKFQNNLKFNELNSFYEMQDKIISPDDFNLLKEKTSGGLVEEIMRSYEHDSSKTIEEYFENL
tara:strand:- start:85 stop:2337 length:2253 start_codon:yes stop_codon:yes gene_type:complete